MRSPKGKQRYVKASISRKTVRRNLRKEILYSLPMFIGMAVIAISHSFAGMVAGGIIAGVSGIIVIWKQEAPTSFVVVRGKPAVVMGGLYVAMTWGLVVLVILAYVFHW